MEMEITRIGDKNGMYFKDMTGDIKKGQGALGVLVEGYPAGAGVFSIENDIAIIDSIFVEEEYRLQGVATFLLDGAKEAFEAAGITHFLAYYPEDEATTAFLENYGFTCIPTDPVFSFSSRMVLGTRQSLSFLNGKTPSGVEKLSDTNSSIKKALIELLDKNGFSGKDILSECQPEISYVYIKKGTPQGIITARKDEDNIYIPFFFSDERGSLTVFSDLISALLKVIRDESKDDTRVYYIGQNEKVTSMLEKLLPPRQNPEKEAGTWSAIMDISNDPVFIESL